MSKNLITAALLAAVIFSSARLYAVSDLLSVNLYGNDKGGSAILDQFYNNLITHYY